MSYKGAWDAIDAMNNLAGEPLVVRAAGGKGGGGTQLTERARRLIATVRARESEHRKFMDNLTRAGLDASGDIDLMRRFMLKTSARNKFLGTVIEVRTGAVNDEILLRIAGGHTNAATITRESTMELGLAPGKEAIALVKASNVIVGAPGPGLRLSARNQLQGKISAVRPGAVNSEILIGMEGGTTLVAIVTNESATDLGLAVGAPAVAIFKASSVILGVLD
ncbi:hypothetical protein G6F65_020064 [Rhizopus arrhizus]|nr:hypothetical protein G6F65_020064 [Rhizopus arrhizus]